ncbi:MAG: YfhO family protein [Patescibacteria group bacterium]|nr:YfhO family protein [Patescibacteria group bacterium]MCL5095185.1 YfhO family protein [Patescibacteria group bacterium]
MKLFLVKIFPIVFFLILSLFFFKPVIFENKLPLPADTIVGLYHPWRDYYLKDYPSGIPFKNFLVTDPVRQQYVWRSLSFDQLKNNHLPLWNPYNFSGMPLLANFQSAVFYPLNILFLIFPFNLGWAIMVMLQPFLAGLFLYQYLRNLKIDKWASFLGAIVFSFSGFSIAWLEWNTIIHTGLWLPLILLSIDKIFQSRNKNLVIWSGLLFLSLISSFFAGHLQVFFYVIIFSLLYLIFRWWQNGRSKKMFLLFSFCFLFFSLITVIQWFPTLQFISQSARNLDQIDWQQPGWFIPWQNLIQLLVPDFFGNPATLNYWGEWNYGEFVSYIGVVPLFFALLAILWRRDKKTLFFGGITFLSLIFALPTFLAKLPYQWRLPLMSTSQPTRLLFMTDFSLSVLAGLGLDFLIKNLKHRKKAGAVLVFLGLLLFSLWLFVLTGPTWFKALSLENLLIAKRNLIFPSLTFLIFLCLVGVYHGLKYRLEKLNNSFPVRNFFYGGILILTILDLFRFGWKFTPFTDKEWLFPQTETIKFLKNQPKPFRFMTTDRRIFPPNFATFYKLEDVAGYDPLYLRDYGEFTSAWYRGRADIKPLSFNRILTPQDYDSKLTDLLNVKYILSLKEEKSPKLKLVFQEGQTRVYENADVLPRTFFADGIKVAGNKQEAIESIFTQDFNRKKIVSLERIETNDSDLKSNCNNCQAEIKEYSENKIIIKTQNTEDGFLVLMDPYYPAWKATIDSLETKIYRTNYAFRGVFVPRGKHEIEFSMSFL